MRKIACTATIFLVLVSVIALVIMSPVRMPNSPVWWSGDAHIETSHECAVPLPVQATVPFWEYAAAQVVVPLLGAALLCGVLWIISSVICNKLRGEE